MCLIRDLEGTRTNKYHDKGHEFFLWQRKMNEKRTFKKKRGRIWNNARNGMGILRGAWNKHISERLDPLMYAAILEILNSNNLDLLVTQTQQAKDMWQKREDVLQRRRELGGARSCQLSMRWKLPPCHYITKKDTPLIPECWEMPQLQGCMGCFRFWEEWTKLVNCKLVERKLDWNHKSFHFTTV